MTSSASTFVSSLKADIRRFGKARRISLRIDPQSYCVWTDGILFYYFSDESKAGVIHKRPAKSRRLNKQAWVVN